MERRREPRHAARIVARVSRRNQIVELLTTNVSFRGVFVRTDDPPLLRQLVKIALVLPPPHDAVVAGHAMVVHVAEKDPSLPKGDGPIPGIGLQFWGAISHGQQWEQFIHDLKRRERLGSAAAKGDDKIRRSSERFKLAIEAEFDGETVMTRDVSESGMAIRTSIAMPVGAWAELTLRAGERTLTFDAIVRRAIDEPGFRGLGIELVDLSPERRRDLVEFVRKHSPSEERILVSPGDPRLH